MHRTGSSGTLTGRNPSWSTDGALGEVTEAGGANPGETQMDSRDEEQVLLSQDFPRLRKSGHCFTSCPEVCLSQSQALSSDLAEVENKNSSP